MQKVLERLLNLLAFLLTVDRPVTADEIRMTVAGYDRSSDEAFRRMFERDKDLLRGLGVPLELSATDAWEVEYGYVIPEDAYTLPDPGLTDEERVALALASQAVRLGGEAMESGAILKLGGAPGVAAGEPLAADLGATASLGDVFAAVSERRMLRFPYRDSERHVSPYGVIHRRGRWYLVAEDSGTVKAFRLDRMGDVALSGSPGVVERPPDFDLATAVPEAPWEAGPDDETARVVFDAEVAWWARRQLGSGVEISEASDGSVTAEIPVRNRDAFIGWILGFDDSAELLGPPDLRSALIERVRGTT
ncbi:MAG: WYL domain-containing protein [Acidimicrobiia bacterium]|nr:WYL domain-containing protein [Acidimicrobiia bacterium]MBT8214887.1 WYL domain-containing protein [Acidimicrobiia bacterium]NNF68651.1 WYL domain-containing protein [Acidimicrobiia bacterium]NNK92649.1 WYL domain-containing protein [Acidimicrobiia bacterium]